MQNRFIMPVTKEGMKKYDGLHPVKAVYQAWNNPGRVPGAHREAQKVVRDAMPLLARALDRLKG